MKKIILLLTFVLAISFAHAQCDERVICQNQDNSDYCLPSDTTCTYLRFEGPDDSCTVDASFVDQDLDLDGWTDNCDAFPKNPEEWFDLDGDAIGANSDCNDFDYTNTSVCNDNDEKEETVPTTEDPSSPTPNGSTGSFRGGSGSACLATWECTEYSDCSEGVKTRECTKMNDCDLEYNKPVEEKGCPLIDFLTLSAPETEGKSTGDSGNSTEETEQKKNPEPVIFEEEKEESNPVAWGILFWFVIPGMLLLILFYKRKKQEQRKADLFY